MADTSPSGGDPRLEIPEILRTPVKKPSMLDEYDRIKHESKAPRETDSTRQAVGWAIAMNFVWTLAATGLFGWAIQKWLWPAAAPWPLVVGLILGIVVGMVRFIRDAIRANNE